MCLTRRSGPDLTHCPVAPLAPNETRICGSEPLATSAALQSTDRSRHTPKRANLPPRQGLPAVLPRVSRPAVGAPLPSLSKPD